jgi:SMC interacting uncharacterized protein involved in chromosome segregation
MQNEDEDKFTYFLKEYIITKKQTEDFVEHIKKDIHNKEVKIDKLQMHIDKFRKIIKKLEGR